MAVNDDTTDAVDGGAGRVAATESAESAAAIGPGVSPARLIAPALLISGAVSLFRLPAAVDGDRASRFAGPGVLNASTLADVAAALGEGAFELSLVAELFEVGDECAGLLVARLPGDDEGESEEPVSAVAIPQPVASATPTPKKTASPPTRPIHPDVLFIRPPPDQFSAKINAALRQNI